MTLVNSTSANAKRWLAIQVTIAFIAGVLCHLSFAPYDLVWFAPISIGILYAQLTLPKKLSPKSQFYLGLSYGFGLFISGLRWVHVSLDTFGGLPLVVTIALLVLLSLYLALYPALAVYVFSKLKQQYPLVNALLFSACWVVFEYLRGIVLTGFPWLWLGYSQTASTFAQSAAVIGVLGLSFFVVLLPSLVINLTKRNISSVMVLVMALGFLWGLTKVESINLTEQKTSVALIQGNIEQSAKWQQESMWPTITRYMELTRLNFDADIIIWPEAAMPAVEGWLKDYLKAMDEEILRQNSALITGIIARDIISIDQDRRQQYYNALITLGQESATVQSTPNYSEQHSNRYYKHQLLPIGEFVPFAEILRPLAPLFNLPMSSFTRGDVVQPNLSANGVKLAAAICYEIAFSELVRQNINDDTDMILTVSNDAWFGQSIGPHQHMQLAQMRAIEMGRPVIRVTNNGITAIVNHHGQITARANQFEEAVLRANVAGTRGQTFYVQFGHTPILSFSALILFIQFLRVRRKYHGQH